MNRKLLDIKYYKHLILIFLNECDIIPSSKLKEEYMKQRILKYIAFFAIIFLLTAVCVPFTANAEDYNYDKNGLEALFIGNNNTGTGQDKNASKWKDLSGKGNDIESVPKDNNNYFTDTGYHLDTKKVFFNSKIATLMNGNAFTVEVSLGDITSKGTSWNTFLNSSNDSFSLFRLISNDTLVVKNQTDSNKANPRPTAANGLDLFKNSTITVTFKVGGKITVYADGKQVAQADATYGLSCGDFFFGHDGAERCYAAEFRAIRFYSKELTAEQVKANYEVDKAVLGKAYGGTTSTPATSGETSSAPSESSEITSSTTSSTASSTATSNSASMPTNTSSTSKTSSSTAENSSTVGGSSNTYIYIIAGVAAVVVIAVVVVVITKKRKTNDQ